MRLLLLAAALLLLPGCTPNIAKLAEALSQNQYVDGALKLTAAVP